MSEELIYKVAEEIYLKLDDLKEQIVQVKDEIQLDKQETRNHFKLLFRLVKQNAEQLAQITEYTNDELSIKWRNNPPKTFVADNTQVIDKLFINATPEYKKEKLDLLNRVGMDKFRSNYLGPNTQKKLDMIVIMDDELN